MEGKHMSRGELNLSEEFDDSFREALLNSMSINTLPDVLTTTFKPKDHGKLLEENRLMKSTHKFCKFLLAGSFHFHMIDLNEITGRGTKSRRTHRKWPYAFLTFYIASLIMIIVNVYHQYAYDASLLKLKQIKSILSNQDAHMQQLFNKSDMDAGTLEIHFEQRVSEAREALKSIGAPQLEWPFIVPVTMIFVSVFGVMFYVAVPIFHSSSDTVLLAVVSLLDPCWDTQIRTELVLKELSALAASSQSFKQTKATQADRDLLDEIRMPVIQKPYLKDLIARSAKRNLNRKHSSTVLQLKRIALEGRLNSPSRSPNFKNRLGRIYLSALCLGTINAAVLPTAFIYLTDAFFKAQGKNIEFVGPKDVIFALVAAYNYLICVISISSTLSLYVLTVYEQIVSIKRLKILMQNIIQLNDIRYHELLYLLNHKNRSCAYMLHNAKEQYLFSRTGSKDELTSIRSAMETDLLMVVLHYRLIVNNFKLAKSLLSYVALMLALGAGMTPILVSLHNNYIDPELREIAFAFSMIIIALCFLFVTPLAWLHEDWLKTFTILWSLSAQLSYFESIEIVNKCFEVESNIAVFTLRRELADLGPRINLFACQILGIPITYKLLIRAGFWLFLALISLLYKSNRSFGLGEDPLGMYELELL
jgi:hypothetical protein